MSGATQAAGLRAAVTRGSVPQRWLTTAARLVLGGVLVAAGALKISDPSGAVRAVQAYRLLPYDLTHAVGYGLPLLEILVGLLLVLGLFTRPAAVVGGVLMVVFIAGIISVWVRGLSIDCGCFGGGGEIGAAGRNSRYATEIARDVGLLALAAWTTAFPASALSVDGWLGLTSGADRPTDSVADDADGWDDDGDDEDEDDTDTGSQPGSTADRSDEQHEERAR
jgi:uncharacterized membrane protein YphA (DoxX/SURF4 family)